MTTQELRNRAAQRLEAIGPDGMLSLLEQHGVDDGEDAFAVDATGLFIGGVMAGLLLAEDAEEIVDAEVVPPDHIGPSAAEVVEEPAE